MRIVAGELQSPDQLPDLKGRKLVFMWDQEGEDSIVSLGDLVVWRERTGWEVYLRFAEIAVILQRKYRARIKDLAPTQRSEHALLGGARGAAAQVQEIRAQLASGKPKKYSYWTLEDAVRKTDLWTLRRYLLAGGYPSATHPNDGVTLLHWAARLRIPAVVRLLVEAGAKLNALDRSGVSPLCEALSETVDPRGRPPLEVADRNARALEVVKLLVEAGANMDGLNRAVSKLTRDADLYRPPLVMAAQHGNVEVVRYLLARGAKVDLAAPRGSTALHMAILYGNLAAVRILIAAGADVNKVDPDTDGLTPLLRAVSPMYGKEHSAEVVRLLVQAGAEVDKSKDDGDTPLMHAISMGSAGVASLLVSLGADIDRRNHDGKSARELARERGVEVAPGGQFKDGAQREPGR